jgi:NAD(P)-dependent dehydrogenase (short-subunit alcohol dehydrogenase family)
LVEGTFMSDTTVLITGASGGLGSTVSAAFQQAGFTVFAPSRSQADISTSAGAQAAVQGALSLHNRLDAVVHLMGGFAAPGPIQDTPEDAWDAMMSINARAAFLLFHAALPVLARPGGRIVAVGARAGLLPPAGLSAYAPSKAALHALIQVIAAENRHAGITANAVLPSVIDTPANRAAMPQADFSTWVSPSSLAQTILWLASDAARDVSGALIPVYGRS